ncbi:hypothetical protein HYT57_02220 [Candidatus Woesearchaeota archaeon]|nr:hypothetical protein [Candidatus Woesearchaeota archaeon]
MTLEIVIPEANVKNRTTKDLVFSILIEEESKTLTQLHREIKRRYGISVTFQAVIKAVNSLIVHKVLVKEGKFYSLSKDWVFETRNFFDRIYTENFKVKKPMKKVELGKEITVYTVSNLLELDRLWNDLLTNWAKKETEDKRNVWRGSHCWWLMPRLQEEDILHDLFARHNIKTYNLLSENTPLDKITINYYKSKKEFIKVKSDISLNSDLNLSSFGEYLVKFEIPKEISQKLEKIYKNTKNNKNLDLKRILDIFKENGEIEVTVIKDKFIANNIKDEVVSYFK